MDKTSAQEITQLSLDAITALSKLIVVSQNNCSKEDYEMIKKGAGMSIGKIQTNILDIIYSKFPELDDLNQ